MESRAPPHLCCRISKTDFDSDFGDAIDTNIWVLVSFLQVLYVFSDSPGDYNSFNSYPKFVIGVFSCSGFHIRYFQQATTGLHDMRKIHDVITLFSVITI